MPASVTQPISLALADYLTQLCDSVAWRPPKFKGIHFTLVKAANAHVLCAEIAVLLANDGIEPVPPADMKTEFYSPYFIVPNLGPACLELGPSQATVQDAHAKAHLRVHPSPRLVCSDRSEGMYFHVSILPCHRPFLRFAFEGRAYQYKVLPFGLSLSPRVFTSTTSTTGSYQLSLRISCANTVTWCSRTSAGWAFGSTGKRANSPRCRGSNFLGMELDLVEQTTCLTQERAQSVLNCLNMFKSRTTVPLKQFQRLLGHMEAAAAVTPLGVLHIRPLQHWLHGRVPSWAWQRGTHRVQVTPACRQTFTLWSDLAFLRAGVPLEQVSRHAVVYMDASTIGSNFSVLQILSMIDLRKYSNILRYWIFDFHEL